MVVHVELLCVVHVSILNKKIKFYLVHVYAVHVYLSMFMLQQKHNHYINGI